MQLFFVVASCARVATIVVRSLPANSKSLLPGHKFGLGQAGQGDVCLQGMSVAECPFEVLRRMLRVCWRPFWECASLPPKQYGLLRDGASCCIRERDEAMITGAEKAGMKGGFIFQGEAGEEGECQTGAIQTWVARFPLACTAFRKA